MHQENPLRRSVIFAIGAAIVAPAAVVVVALAANAGTITYQAESSANTLSGGAVVKSCSGCAGGKKVGNVGNNAGTLRFNGINAAVSGSAKIAIRYVNGGTTNRTATMRINGGTASTKTFPPSGGWAKSATLTVTATLKAGSNTITFANPTAGKWAPDFDQVTVTTADSTTDPYARIPKTDALVEVTTNKLEVALTLDDGPWPYSGPGTLKFLDLIKSKGAHETIFMIGQQIGDLPSALVNEVSNGDQVGNHTWTHPDLTTLSAAEVQSQLTQTTAKIKSTCGQTPKVFRPPYGATNATINQQARSLGLVPILWSIDSEDWTLPGVPTIVNNVMSQIHPGAIVLMHDGGGDRTQSYQALSQILDQLKAKGYSVVTIDQLVHDGTPVTQTTL
jgi:peptidoglycan-N-acetylglucosamine deacetylase